MSMCIVRIQELTVEFSGDKATVTVVLPHDYRTNYVSDARGRRQIEQEKNPGWTKNQIKTILDKNNGCLADVDHPVRSYGSGILARVSTVSSDSESVCILHVRGSNRGSVWPVGASIADVLCWKEFAGVTGSPDELLDPRITAIKELYEELSFASNDKILIPSNIHDYPDTFQQVEVAIRRINKHYSFNVSPAYGCYPAVTPDNLKGDPNTTVVIKDGNKEKKKFNAVVNYNPHTNSIEISFLADITLKQPLTGILSLSGPENADIELRPYMEDVIVVSKQDLKQAKIGQRLDVKHLLSVHGPTNLIRAKTQSLFYTPGSTLEPLVSSLNGTYSFRRVLEEALKKL